MANGREDIRLAVGWVDHLKTKKLIKAHGPNAALCLLRLWSYASVNHPRGVFDTSADLETASGWTGKSGVLIGSLIEIGWVEKDGRTLHNWLQEQPYIADREKRVALAKHAAHARWGAVKMR